MTCSLERALAYENADVVHKFADHFGVADAEAELIFAEAKKWLWLNSLEDRPPLAVTSEIQVLDEMWHTFVLFTRDYSEYCQSRFGRYMHHKPTSRREKEAEAAEPEAFDRRRRQEMAIQYRFIAAHLGDDTLVRWYADYPLRYGRDFFARFGIDLPELAPEVAARMRALVASDHGGREARP